MPSRIALTPGLASSGHRRRQKLQQIQNDAARIVLQAPWRSDVNSLLRRCTGCPLNSASTILAGRADVQDSTDVISAVSEPAHLVSHQRTQHSTVVRPTAMRDISMDIIRQTIAQHCRAHDLELTATCCFQIQTCHVLYSFLLTNLLTCSASASVGT